jgi:hypothetical protein
MRHGGAPIILRYCASVSKVRNEAFEDKNAILEARESLYYIPDFNTLRRL